MPITERDNTVLSEIVKEEKSGMRFGAYFPQEKLTNKKMASWETIKTSKGELATEGDLFRRTGGIKLRYVANEEETPFYMAKKAAEEALDGDKSNHAVIVTTSYIPDYDLSERLQKEFGFSGYHEDIYAACSGIGAKLAYFKRHEKRFMNKKILVVATEKPSEHLHNLKEPGENNRDTSQLLFTDVALAVAFVYGRDLKILSVKEHIFEGTENYIRMPIDREKLQGRRCFEIPIPYPDSGKFEQDGNKVYRLLQNHIPNFIRKSIGEAGLTDTQIKKLFIHQGSGRVVEAIIEHMPEFRDHIWRDYEDGNPSSGSAPRGMMRAAREGAIEKGDCINVTFFGGGKPGMHAFSATLQL